MFRLGWESEQLLRDCAISEDSADDVVAIWIRGRLFNEANRPTSACYRRVADSVETAQAHRLRGYPLLLKVVMPVLPSHPYGFYPAAWN